MRVQGWTTRKPLGQLPRPQHVQCVEACMVTGKCQGRVTRKWGRRRRMRRTNEKPRRTTSSRKWKSRRRRSRQGGGVGWSVVSPCDVVLPASSQRNYPRTTPNGGRCCKAGVHGRRACRGEATRTLAHTHGHAGRGVARGMTTRAGAVWGSSLTAEHDGEEEEDDGL